MTNLCKIAIIMICYHIPAEAQTSADDINLSVKEFDLANVAMMKKDAEQAYIHLQKAASLDPTNSTFLNSAAFMAMSNGELDVAMDYLDDALPLDVERYGESHPAVASVLSNMGTVWSKKGDHKKAVEFYEQALAIVEKELGKTHPRVVNIREIRDAEKSKAE